jgi:hypothetical protein
MDYANGIAPEQKTNIGLDAICKSGRIEFHTLIEKERQAWIELVHRQISGRIGKELLLEHISGHGHLQGLNFPAGLTPPFLGISSRHAS